jgi:HEAT repeat protein
MHHDHSTPARIALGCALILVAFAAAAGAVTGPQDKTAPAKAGARPAASGIDPILKELSVWNGGIESAAVWKLRDYVYARKDDAGGRAECEGKLLAFLKTTATPVAKMTACRHLRIIAGDTAVPALQAMLADERGSDLALYVLEKIPGAVADKALVHALGTLAGPTKVSIIAAIGERRQADAVPALSPLLKQTAFAGPAATALGAIGGDAASQALTGTLPGAAGELKATVAAALMRCAEQAVASKNDAAALRLYEAVFADPALPAPTHRAAALGRIAAAGTGAQSTLLEFLTGPDPGLQQAAVMRIKEVVPPDAIGQVCALMPRLPEPTRAQVVAALGGYPKERVLPAVLDAARNESAIVRLAALKALETVGDQSAVTFLLDVAAKSKGAEQAAARSALGLLKGRAVDERLLALLAQNPPEEINGELLLAVGERRVFTAKPVVAAALASASSRVRVQALRSIRSIGTPSDIPAVLDLVVRSADGPEQTEAETTTAALAQKIINSDSRSTFVKARLAEAKDPAARVRLIGVLSLIGDSSALPTLRTALAADDPDVYDAAVRALTAWPTAAARDDVFRLARDSRNETHRLLAIRALVRTITLDKHRDPAAAVADLRSAAGFSWRPEEQRLVLGALAQFPCRDALELARGFLREASVKPEAEAAIEKITERLKQAQ